MAFEEKKAWAEDLLRQKYTELGRPPTKKDFDSAACAQIKAYLGPWPRALETAGLKETKEKQPTSIRKDDFIMRATKKILGMILAVVMVLGLFPAAAFATDLEALLEGAGYISVSDDVEFVTDVKGDPMGFVAVPLEALPWCFYKLFTFAAVAFQRPFSVRWYAFPVCSDAAASALHWKGRLTMTNAVHLQQGGTP